MICTTVGMLRIGIRIRLHTDYNYRSLASAHIYLNTGSRIIKAERRRSRSGGLLHLKHNVLSEYGRNTSTYLKLASPLYSNKSNAVVSIITQLTLAEQLSLL